MIGRVSLGLLLASLCLALPIEAADTPPPPSDSQAFFTQRVAPILSHSCLHCHGMERQKGHLRLDSRDAMLRGGGRGPALVPEHPEQSLIMTAVRYGDDDLQMPPDQPLADRQIQDLESWIRQGALWAGGEPAAASQPSAASPNDHQSETGSEPSWEAGRPLVGKLHLLVVHFPIAALSLALLAELLAMIRGPSWDPAVRLLLITGTAGAIAAVISGSWFTDEGSMLHRGGDLPLTLHERFGWATMLVAITATILLFAGIKRPGMRWTFRAILLTGAALAGLTAHLGGEMKYGSHWLF